MAERSENMPSATSGMLDITVSGTIYVKIFPLEFLFLMDILYVSAAGSCVAMGLHGSFYIRVPRARGWVTWQGVYVCSPDVRTSRLWSENTIYKNEPHEATRAATVIE